MTPADRLTALHLRLVNDEQVAFTSLGDNRIRPTPAGRAWLRDYAAYNRLYDSIPKPAAILHDQLGYIVGD